MLEAMKCVKQAGNNQKRVPKSPLSDLNFYHENTSGFSWEQGYQFVQIATCNAPVIKANLSFKVDFKVKKTLSFKT